MPTPQDDLKPAVLDYCKPPARSTLSRRVVAGTLTWMSAIFAVLPCAGLSLRIGPLFFGGLLLSVVGVLLAIGVLVMRQSGAALKAVAALLTLSNGISIAFGFWLVFVRGRC